MKNIPLELAAIFDDANDDPAVPDDQPDFLDKFLKETSLGAAMGRGGHAHVYNLAIETAPVHAAVAAHYRKIAENAAKKEPAAAGGDPHRLEKSARRIVAGDPNDTRKVARTETTKYSSGKMLHAEIDQHGEVIRIVEEAA
jgi:hypothetical protein